MTSSVLIPQRFTYDLDDFVIQFGERRFKTRLVTDAVGGGENLESGNTEQVFTRVIGIAGQMCLDERFDLTPIRKLARGFTRSCQQNAIVAERTAQEQNVGMSIWHSLIMAQGAI